MKIAFRADASIEVGARHVMRCLALADALARRGGDVAFLTASSTRELISAIRARGYLACVLDESSRGCPAAAGDHPGGAAVSATAWEEDAEGSIAALASFGQPDWLVVDHYGLDARWEARLRRGADRILVIDDRANRPHDCDILLDQNYVNAMETRYLGVVPEGCTQLLGPRYALLRRDFSERRRPLRKRDGLVRNILLSFGGADSSNETSKALRALLELQETAVAVVVDAFNPRLRPRTKSCSHSRRSRRGPRVCEHGRIVG